MISAETVKKPECQDRYAQHAAGIIAALEPWNRGTPGTMEP
jgi:hypothetical protein